MASPFYAHWLLQLWQFQIELIDPVCLEMWQFSNQLPLLWPPERLKVSSCIYTLGNRNHLTPFTFWFLSFLATDATIILVEDINNYFTTGNDNKRGANYRKIGNPSQESFYSFITLSVKLFSPQNPVWILELFAQISEEAVPSWSS